MKPYLSNQTSQALTLLEVLVIVTIVALMALLIESGTATQTAKRRAQRINCVSNLKQVNLAWRDWQVDGSTNVTQAAVPQDAATFFRCMSNELVTPKILICPADTDHSMPAINFQSDFNNSHIGYFINPNAGKAYPQQLTIGDDNLAIDGVAVKSGILVLTSKTSVSWTAARHVRCGNVGYADGSVTEVTTAGLQSSFILSVSGTPNTTNRLAIP